MISIQLSRPLKLCLMMLLKRYIKEKYLLYLLGGFQIKIWPDHLDSWWSDALIGQWSWSVLLYSLSLVGVAREKCITAFSKVANQYLFYFPHPNKDTVNMWQRKDKLFWLLKIILGWSYSCKVITKICSRLFLKDLYLQLP